MTTKSNLQPRTESDGGFTLVEILIVIVIIGIMAAVTIFAVRGITDKGEESACGADTRSLTTAADVYMAQENVSVLPATGGDDDRFEQTLIDAGLLKSVSTYYDLNADGTVSTNGVPCT